MTLLYKRPGSPNFYVTKTRESTRTPNRKLAEEFARKSITEHWRSETLGEVQYTWESLAEDWLDQKDGRPSCEQDRMVIDRVAELLKRREVENLEDIDGDLVAYYAKVVKASSSASTANRHLTTIRAMLRRAAAKGWIAKVPNIENYQLTKNEVTWLTIDQFNQVAAHLPEWVRDMAVMAVQTGMRFSNVAGLQWKWISQDGSVVVVPAVHTKTGRTYTVPLSKVAREVIQRLAKLARNDKYVFVGASGEAPVKSIRFWWEQAREAAGFPHVRWHDLRHCWASWHVQNATPDRILAQMGGWASTRMLENYAHLATSHLTAYADNLNKV